MIEHYKKVNYLHELENIIQTMKKLQMSQEEIDKAEKLMQQITAEPDVTLENVMVSEIKLSLEKDFETRIKEKIEELKNQISTYMKEFDINNTEKYKSILEDNIYLLGYVPIKVIKRNVDFYDEYFKLLGIDINEFLEIDKRVQQLNLDIKKSLRIDKRVNKFNQNIEIEVNRTPTLRGFVTVKASSEIFRLMPDKIKEEDPKWCKRCVANDRSCFQYVPDKVKEEDPKWCKRCVANDSDCFKYVPDKIKEEDPDWCKKMVAEHSFQFKYVPDKVKEEDPEWCKEVVSSYGEYFEYVPDKVKEKDPNWCKHIVDRNMNCFQYVPDKVKEEDSDWCKKIVDKYSFQFQYVPDKVKEKYPEWCKDIVNKDISYFKYVPDKVKEKYPEWCKDIVNKDISRFKYVPDKVKEEDSEWCKDIVNKEPFFFRYVPDKVKEEDPEWCKDIVNEEIIFSPAIYKMIYNCSFQFQYVPDKVKEENPKWCKKIVNEYISYFQYVPDKVKEEDPDWCKDIVNKEPFFFRYVPDKVKEEDPEWCKGIVNKNISYFQYVPDKVKEEDIGYCESVILKAPYNFIHLPEKVKTIIIKNGNTEILEKVIEIDPYRVITLNIETVDKYLETIKDIENVKRFEYVAKSMSEYIDDFYDGKLNLERMRAIAPSNEKVKLQTEPDEMDVMKNIYEGISLLATDKDVYQEKADELFREYKELREKDKLSSNYYEELKLLIYKIGTLEIEIGAKNNSYSSRKEAEEAYRKRREELIEMISKIKTMNPELAEKYEQELKNSDNSNIEHIIDNGAGHISSEQIELENKVQFYLRSNVAPSNQELVVYNPKNDKFFNKIFRKLFKGKKETQIKTEYDLSSMSLNELYELQKKVNEEIYQREKFRKGLQFVEKIEETHEKANSIITERKENIQDSSQNGMNPYDED